VEEDFTLARLFYVAASAGILDEGSEEACGLAFDRMPYGEKAHYNDALRAVFRAAAANPELARGLT
jgi:hypothetical protein